MGIDSMEKSWHDEVDTSRPFLVILQKIQTGFRPFWAVTEDTSLLFDFSMGLRSRRTGSGVCGLQIYIKYGVS